MKNENDNLGFFTFIGICVLGLAGFVFYLNKKETPKTETKLDSKPEVKPTTALPVKGFAGSNTSVSEPIKQVTPEMVDNLTVDGLVSSIIRLNSDKNKNTLDAESRKSLENAIELSKKKLADFGYRFDEILNKAVKITTNEVLNISQNQSNKALLNNQSITDEEKANGIAKKIQLVIYTQSATQSNLSEYLNDILDLGYIFERNDKGEGVARKVYDINRIGTDVIAKGFLGKSVNLPEAKEYPIKLYKKSSTGVLTEIDQKIVLSSEDLTKMGDALEDKLKQINEQNKSIIKENRELYKLSKTPAVMNDTAQKVLYNLIINLLFRLSNAQRDYLKYNIENKFGIFAKLNFSYNNSGTFGQIKRDNRVILDFPNPTFS